MKLRVYSTTEPFENKKGELTQGYFFVKTYKGSVQHLCLYGTAGKEIGDYVEVKYSRINNKFFIANENQNENN